MCGCGEVDEVDTDRDSDDGVETLERQRQQQTQYCIPSILAFFQKINKKICSTDVASQIPSDD